MRQYETTGIVASKINLVDLAGSERQSTSNKDKNMSRFKESASINTSLLTLGKIIYILSDQSKSANPSQSIHVPYRESSLTYLLRESLGGNSKTSMLATINSTSAHLEETLCTLRYAAQAKCITNSATLNHNQKWDDMTIELSMMKKNTLNENLLARIKNEWQLKLDEANRRKEDELRLLEKQMIQIYENENQSRNCCLINLTEDMLFSEKLIYIIRVRNSMALVTPER
jgi:hypothetical protein